MGELAGTATGYAFVVHRFACLVCCLQACQVTGVSVPFSPE